MIIGAHSGMFWRVAHTQPACGVDNKLIPAANYTKQRMQVSSKEHFLSVTEDSLSRG